MSEKQTAGHTPGPWRVGFNAMDVVASSAKRDEFKICDLRGWGYLTGKGHGALGLSHDEAVAVQTANAHLIAAAPALLAALEELAAAVTQEVNTAGTSLASGNVLARLSDARAAIAKAKGEQRS